MADGAVRIKGPASVARVEVAVEAAPAYELLLGLRAFADTEDDRSSYAVGPEWWDAARERAPKKLLRDIDRFTGGEEMLFGMLVGFVAALTGPKDIPALIAAVKEIDPIELRRWLLGYHLSSFREGVSRETIDRAARGDAEAEAELLAAYDDHRIGAVKHALSLPAEEAKELIVRIVEAWNDKIFSTEASEVMPLLESSAAEVRDLASTLPVDRLVDRVAPGIRYTSEPGIRRLLLVPSFVGRPWLVMSECDDTKCLCYGIDEQTARGVDAPPEAAIAVYRALGDANRVRLMKRLSRGSASLQQLTEHVGLAKSTVHAHLLILRTSGLVECSLADKTYTLRRPALAVAHEALESFLDRGLSGRR